MKEATLKICNCKRVACFNRDANNMCHALASPTYKEACPFAKSKETELKELLVCSARLDMKPSEYKKVLKSEVFDIFQGKNLFEGD